MSGHHRRQWTAYTVLKLIIKDCPESEYSEEHPYIDIFQFMEWSHMSTVLHPNRLYSTKNQITLLKSMVVTVH